MNFLEVIKELETKIRGYSGYKSLENRQDTMDVFTAWLFGRVKKKMDDLETHYKSWASLPDFGEIAFAYTKLVEILKIALKHLKYDSKDIAPFLTELDIKEEEVHSDIVKLDGKAYALADEFCKLLEDVKTMQLDIMNQASSLANDLVTVLRERTKRINTLNKVFYYLQENVRVLCSKISSDNLDEKTIQGITLLTGKYPKRIETYLKVMEAFKNARPLYENYNEQTNFSFKYNIFRLYLDHYPRLLNESAKIINDFKPSGEIESKALESLKKAIANPPDFEKLKKALEEMHKNEVK